MTSITMLAYGFSTISGRRRESLSLLQRNKESTVCEGIQQLVGNKNRGSIKHERCSALLDAVPSPQTVNRGESFAHPQPGLRELLGQALAQLSTNPQAFTPAGVCLLCSAVLRDRGTSLCTGKAFFKVGFTDILSQTWVMVPGDCIKTAYFFF